MAVQLRYRHRHTVGSGAVTEPHLDPTRWLERLIEVNHGSGFTQQYKDIIAGGLHAMVALIKRTEEESNGTTAARNP